METPPNCCRHCARRRDSLVTLVQFPEVGAQAPISPGGVLFAPTVGRGPDLRPCQQVTGPPCRPPNDQGEGHLGDRFPERARSSPLQGAAHPVDVQNGCWGSAVHSFAHAHTHACTHTHMCTHAHRHTCTHAHTCTHRHTCVIGTLGCEDHLSCWLFCPVGLVNPAAAREESAVSGVGLQVCQQS